MSPTWVKLLGIAAFTLITIILTKRKDKDMYNSHDDILSYHKEEVTLPESERSEMRDRRNTNRTQLEEGLDRAGEPKPMHFKSQGSYEHRTMVQHKNKDYDIDDGVYFSQDDLKGPKGGDKSASDAKEMVRKALHKDQFKRPPEVRTNCVRVYYDAGYHVDVPVYREVKTPSLLSEETHYEIASTDWKESDPAKVTDWFNEQNKCQSPNGDNQLRRLTRLLKAFARSRDSWRDKIASGFMITTLIVDECYKDNLTRDDEALYDTMVAIRDRLEDNLEIRHPIMEGEMLTSGPDDAKTRFLKEKLDTAIDDLSILFDPNCSRKQMLEAWDRVFHTTFFSDRLESEDTTEQKGAGFPAILTRGKEEEVTESPVDKRGGGRYA